MFSLPLAIVLIPYAIFIIVFLIFALINVFHLVHYGQTTRISFTVTFIFFIVTSFILFATWAALRHIDWSAPLEFSIPTIVPGAPAGTSL